MFFDRLDNLTAIAARTSCSIFVVPPSTRLAAKTALYLEPEPGKTIISVEQLRDFLTLTSSRETADRFFVIAPADAMNESAMNAFLKTLEEPHDFCHFVLLTEQPAALLPTIRSRAQLFVHRTTNRLAAAPVADPKTLALAKRLIAATPLELPALATDLAKAKPSPRQTALSATAVAIELLYKSYFKTQNPKFLQRLPAFLALHDALTKNGHVKLQIVANLC